MNIEVSETIFVGFGLLHTLVSIVLEASNNTCRIPGQSLSGETLKVSNPSFKAIVCKHIILGARRVFGTDFGCDVTTI
jgi:hypothetical protein